MTLVWTQGTTSEGAPIGLQRRDGSPINLSGATVTMQYKRTDGGIPNVMTALTGTVTLDDPANGKFTFKFSTADVATAGRYGLQIKVDYGGGVVWFSDVTDFLITPTT